MKIIKVMNWFEDDISPTNLQKSINQNLICIIKTFGLGNMKNKELGEK